MSGRYDRQNKILEAVRQLIKNGWSKMEINDSLYNIGINQKDVINALDVIESELLEAELIQAGEAQS